jgi:nitrile hydratase subunit beta
MATIEIVTAAGERPVFSPGDRIRIKDRTPIGHYRVPHYLRGKAGIVDSIIEPVAVDNEEEGYGRNAGARLHYYRIAIPLTEIWPDYRGAARDGLYIEVYETWLERLP